MNGAAPKPPAPWKDYRRVVPFIFPYWRRLGLVFSISLLSTLLSLIQPYFAKVLVDDALLGSDKGVLVLIAALMMVVTILGFAFTILAGYSYVKISADVLFDMRLALYRRLQQLSPRFYAQTKMGDIVSRINNDIGEIQRVASDAILSFLSSLIFLAGSILIMVWLDWRLFLVGVAVLPLCLGSLNHYQRKLTGRVRTLRERSAEIGSFLIETLMGMRVVVTSNAQPHEVGRFRLRNKEFISALLSMQLTSRLAAAVPGTLLALSTALVFLYGGTRVIDGDISLGALIAFMAYHLRLLGPLQNLFGLYTGLATARVSLSRVFELMDSPLDVSEAENCAPLGEIKGAIQFENVYFTHHRGDRVLDGVSFELSPGTICAIVGPSGGGKSTIADLIVRLYDPDEGTVRLDGRDLREIGLSDLREKIALVDQTPYLFNATVRENIAYAKPEAGDGEIIQAAQRAGIHDFIQSLPKGYSTEVGERGLAMSAGQRQRLSTARALLRDPAVLVLDEPTAALDPANAEALAQTLSKLLAGRTAIVITHDARLLEIADQIITLESGKLRAPDELATPKGGP